MTLTIELSAAAQQRLAERAARNGKTVETLARELIEEAISPEKTLDEVLVPFAQSFAESGMTEQELDALVEKAREEIWQEQQAAKPIIVTEPRRSGS